MKAIIISLLIGLCLCTGLYAQKAPIKFGKVSKEEMEMTQCEFYPEAKSMALCEYGILRFEYNDNQGWRYKMYVTVRNKIFDKTDKDAGNIKIRYYEPEKTSSKEVVSGLKGYTYNLKDGKIEKVKLQGDQIHKTRITPRVKELSFAMPNIQEGSVFEYTYTITSEFLMNLKTWHFQGDIPVLHGEFIYEIPEYFYYQISQEGHVLPIEHEVTNTQNNYFNVPGGVINSKHTRMVAKNIPPILDEPYINNKVDLPNRVQFQLSQIIVPGQVNKNFGTDYYKFSKELIDDESFGKRLIKGGFSKDWSGALTGMTPAEKAQWIYRKFQADMTWNTDERVFSAKAGKAAYKEGEGSSAEINLSLISAFREFGLEAHPVILSTRGSGRPHPTYPNYNDFNYVIALVKIGDKSYFADATSPMPLGMLPRRCLNASGWLVKATGGKWIKLKTGALFQQSLTIHTVIGEEEIHSSVNLKENAHAAMNALSSYRSLGEEKFQAEISEDFPEAEIDSLSFELSDESLETTTKFKLVQEADGEGVIYLKPLNYGIFTENPFTRDTRSAPIDLPYAFKKNIMMQIELPKGYEAEIPKPTMIRLPNKKGVFTYQVMQNGHILMINSQFKLEQLDFTHEEYPALKQLFELMQEKNNQVLVIKKT